MTELSTGATIGDYRIEGVAGRGGMGIVYRATQITLERPVALKVIAPELADDEVFRERFKRESHTAASIDHPNVIPIYEAGEAHGQLFIAMRWVEGTDLRDLIGREGRLRPEQAVGVVERVAAALDAAHRRGLVHRDVKPANVLVVEEHGEHHVYLTDFGLTKRAASVGGMTRTGQFVGTPDYSAPEQIRGEPSDARTDVYALGCLLYQTLTGQVPYERESEVAKIYAHLNDPAPSVAEVAPDAVPLDAVIARAMAKEPDERYPSCGDLGRAARAALTGAPARAPERTVAAGAAAPAPPAEEETRPVSEAAPAAEDETRPAPETAPAAEEETRRVPEAEAAAASGAPPGRRPRGAVVGVAALLVVGLVAAVVALAGVFGSGDGGGLAGGGGEGPSPSQPVVAATIRVGPGPDGLAVGGGRVWVALSENASVTPIDVRTNRAAKTVPIGVNPDSVAIGGNKVWVTLTDENAVRRVDTSGERPAPDSAVQVGNKPESVALGAQLAWVANSGEDTVKRLDRASAQPVGASIHVGDTPVGVFVGPKDVWVTNNRAGTLTRIGVSNAEVIGDPIRVGRGPRGVVEGGGAVWVVNSGAGTVTRVDPESGKVVGDPIRVGDNPREVAFGAGAVWVTDSGEGSVRRIDPRTGKVVGRPIKVGSEPIGVAFGAGAVWVANHGEGTVSRIEP